MEKIIAIFDKEFVPTAFLALENGKIVPIYLDSSLNDVVEEVVEGIASKKHGGLSMRREHRDAALGSVDIFMEEILPSNNDYIFAVAERFGNAGFLAAVIYKDLQELFVELGKKELSFEEKNKIWAEMINMDEHGAGALVKFAEQMKPIVKELEDLDEKWKDFVHKKQIEISQS